MTQNRPSEDLTRQFIAMVRQNPGNAAILDRFGQLGFQDWWLTAGCLAQTVWNVQTGLPPETGIHDYDVFYFDPDTSWEAEDRVITAANALFHDLPAKVEIRNQARVPIWYEAKFGRPYPAVTEASDGIDRFAYQTTAVGICKRGDEYLIHAPFGLNALLEGVIVPNPVVASAEVYYQKVVRWKQIWPHLIIQPWPGTDLPAGL